MVFCQLHETGWLLSVSYMRENGGYLSGIMGKYEGYLSAI
jgi:hypothetical protein